MTNIITSPEDVINLSLARIGSPVRIGSIYDGSQAAKKSLDIYSQTRDELLRTGDYYFSQRNVALTLLKQSPQYGYIPPIVWNNTYPPQPWFFEYAYPDDCLKIRSIRGRTIFPLNYDPVPNSFSIENDQSYTPPQKVILCNVPDAIMTYTAQVTDPSTWESDYIEALAAGLGKRLAPVLLGLQNAQMAAADAATTEAEARVERG